MRRQQHSASEQQQQQQQQPPQSPAKRATTASAISGTRRRRAITAPRAIRAAPLRPVLIKAGSHGGCHTSSTLTSRTCGIAAGGLPCTAGWS